jgi:clan AA aspartic protease
MHMGSVYEKITLVNGGDVEMVERGFMKEPQIRQITVTALVDTGATNLVIGESACQKLGLAIREMGAVTVAGGKKEPCKITASVIVRWKDRQTECPAMVLPGEEEVLLGAIPLEGLDLMVNPVDCCIVGAHGDNVVYIAK